jgi:hypothetical protein
MPKKRMKMQELEPVDPELRLWPILAVARAVGADRKTLTRLVEQGQFPPPTLLIGNGAKRARFKKLWHKEVVLDWLRERAEAAVEAVE